MKTLQYKKTTISYSDQGSGKAVVFLHGFLENKNIWKPYTTALSNQFRIITIDLLGHGGTGCLGYIHEMEEHAKMIHFVLKQIKIHHCAIVGHSMGGYVGLAFAEKHPDQVTKLVLLNSTSKEDSPEKKINRGRAINAVKQNHTTFVSLAIANLFTEENRARYANEIETIKNEALATPLQGIIASLEGMKIRKDREFILKSNTFPILLILGKRDPVLNYQETVEQVTGSTTKLISYPDGHMSYIENQEQLTADLSLFFSL